MEEKTGKPKTQKELKVIACASNRSAWTWILFLKLKKNWKHVAMYVNDGTHYTLPKTQKELKATTTTNTSIESTLRLKLKKNWKVWFHIIIHSIYLEHSKTQKELKVHIFQSRLWYLRCKSKTQKELKALSSAIIYSLSLSKSLKLKKNWKWQRVYSKASEDWSLPKTQKELKVGMGMPCA